MAGTVTPILTTVHDCDGLSDWTGTPTLDTEVFIQGTGSLSKKVSKTTSTHMKPITAVDLSDTIIYVWVMGSSISQFDTKANGGIRIRVEQGATPNWGEWYVAGKDEGYEGGWQCLAIRTTQAFSAKSDPAPTMTAIDKVGVVFGVTASAAKINCWWDAVRYGTGLNIKGGTLSDPATFADIVAAEETAANRWGVVVKTEKVLMVQGKLTFGSTTAGEATYFKDMSKIMVFRDRAFGVFYELKVQGNGTATTKVYWGDKSGGRGISGCIFNCAGASKYKVIATDTNITELGIYGCTFMNADTISLPIYSATREVLSSNFEACAEILPDTCTMKYCNIISASDRGLRIIAVSPNKNVTECNFISCPRAVHIASTGTYDFDGLNFSGNIYDVDNSSGGTVTVNSSNSLNPPSTKINSVEDNQESNNTDFTLPGNMRTAQRKTISNRKVARLQFLLRKFGAPTGNITFAVRKVSDDSVLQSVVLGAAGILTTIDTWYEKWFSSPPTINEEIRLCAEHTGDASNYIIARYQNTDVKATEYRSTWTSPGPWSDLTTHDHTYRALLHDPTVTTNIINTVYLTVDVEDENGDPVIGASVYIENATTKAILMKELTVLTDGKGRAQETYNYAPPPFAINVRVRKSSANGTRYIPYKTTGEVTASGYTLTVVLIKDLVLA